MTSTLSTEYILTHFTYDPATGVVHRLRSQGTQGTNGTSRGKDSYLRFEIQGHRYYAHRIAWVLQTGEWPTEDIDHINGIRYDNRWSNLRLATRSLNMQNIGRPRRDNTSGHLGVYVIQLKDGRRWIAQIKVNGKCIKIGRFDTPEAAAAAYMEAKRRLHPGSQRL